MGRRQGVDDDEILIALRVLSLSDDATTENSVDALLAWISGLQARVEFLEQRLITCERLVRRTAKFSDLEAENRALRVALNDSLSYKRASVKDATTALVAVSAPTASKAKDREDG